MKMVHIQKKEELAQIVGKYFEMIAFVRDLLPRAVKGYFWGPFFRIKRYH